MKLIVITQAPDLGKPSQTPCLKFSENRHLGFQFDSSVRLVRGTKDIQNCDKPIDYFNFFTIFMQIDTRTQKNMQQNKKCKFKKHDRFHGSCFQNRIS